MKNVLGRLVRQSPAMIVAMLALFVALTGTAVATTSALITGNQIKNNSITGLDIKNKSLTSKDIKGQLRGARGLRGLAGTAGAKGDKGDKGDIGPSDAYYVFNNGVNTITTLAVPAGNYVAYATNYVANNGANVTAASCSLFSVEDSAHEGQNIATVPDIIAGFDYESLAAQTVFNFPSGGTIRYSCSGGSATLQYYQFRITAIKVGALH